MPLRKPWLILLLTTVTLVVGISLYVSGSPMQARAQRLDRQRVNDLQQISYALDSFWSVNHRLPKNLEELIPPQNQGASYYVASIRDPETGMPYEYQNLEHSQPDGDPTQAADEPGTYEVCATFSTEVNQNTGIQAPYDSLFSIHPKGRTCLSNTVRTLHEAQIK